MRPGDRVQYFAADGSGPHPARVENVQSDDVLDLEVEFRRRRQRIWSVRRLRGQALMPRDAWRPAA